MSYLQELLDLCLINHRSLQELLDLSLIYQIHLGLINILSSPVIFEIILVGLSELKSFFFRSLNETPMSLPYLYDIWMLSLTYVTNCAFLPLQCVQEFNFRTLVMTMLSLLSTSTLSRSSSSLLVLSLPMVFRIFLILFPIFLKYYISLFSSPIFKFLCLVSCFF